MSNKQKPRTDGFTGDFYQIFQELTPLLLKKFCKIQEEKRLLNSSYKTSIILIPKPDKDTTKKIIDQYPWWT